MLCSPHTGVMIHISYARKVLEQHKVNVRGINNQLLLNLTTSCLTLASWVQKVCKEGMQVDVL